MIATQYTLVARLRKGGSDSDWQRFYDLYEKPLLAFAGSFFLNDAECADVLQETMIKMLRTGFARFDPAKGRFTGFLFNIARCCAIDALRRRARERSHSLDGLSPDHSRAGAEQVADMSETPFHVAERNGQIALIHSTLDFLIERKCFQRRTVQLFKSVTLEQREPREVAKTFATSVGNVYEAKRAVLVRLRNMLVALDQGLDLEQAFAHELSPN
jgi:RNA polymerase sigma factor (sigma-70 family)